MNDSPHNDDNGNGAMDAGQGVDDSPPWDDDAQGDDPLAGRDPNMPENALGLDMPAEEKPAAKPAQDMAKQAEQKPATSDNPKAQAEPAPTVKNQPYRVLARKYRPQKFDELIGQDAMVQTLANAIKRDRLAHAFLMTGVRGVGKTTTARLIAKALNCIGSDGNGQPTINPCDQCEACLAIAEGRHIDVIEMDAASHTGVDDVREIIEAVRYSSVSARYKIYIIDEVHMLSKNAFNALLKTLEEPPAHVKFLFATTEVNKIPITVLSRCQRFDLKRISSEKLAAHFAAICEKEKVEAESDALAMISEAAQGSVRDGLSILDQAIAHADMEGGDNDQIIIHSHHVRDMLGLSDRSAMRQLFAAILDGEPEAMLKAVQEQFALGIDPLAIINGLMAIVHAITLYQSAKASSHHGEEDRKAIAIWAEQLGAANLHRIWQLLLKGHGETATAPMPFEACEMLLLRIVHAAQLPDPAQMLELLNTQSVGGNDISQSPLKKTLAPADKATQKPENNAVAPQIVENGEKPEPARNITSSENAGNSTNIPENANIAAIETIADLYHAVKSGGEYMLAEKIRNDLRLIECKNNNIKAASSLPNAEQYSKIAPLLETVTEETWQVDIVPADNSHQQIETLADLEKRKKSEIWERKLASPIVEKAKQLFPDAQITQDGDNAGHAPGGRQQMKRR